MALPDELRSVLPPDTVRIWALVAPVVPRAAYLVGGTAVAVHLRHRPSRDLDFFFHGAVDAIDLGRLGGRTDASFGAIRGHSGDEKQALITSASCALPAATHSRPRFTSPRSSSARTAAAAAVGERPARRATARAEASPSGERARAERTRISARLSPGTSVATPSSWARRRTWLGVS